ncbi:MAG: methyltransferase, FxLD system [Dermatophilaceae bacterium]
MTSSTAAADQSYAELRAQMVTYLIEATGDARTPTVIAALGKVPRHRVIGEADTADPAMTYDAENIVVTKKDTDGNNISSVSAARIQAIQLEQADLRAGHRVLEIGSGGVNAAYLAEIVGPDGLVVTLDIDPEVTARASRFLASTGYDPVVVTADGAGGAPCYAPFDRILVTVETVDVPPAWWDQLADDSIIIAPLRMGGMTRTVALTRDASDPDLLASDDLQLCGFVPMQGAGTNPQHRIVLNGAADSPVALRLDGDTSEGAAHGLDAAGLAAALHEPRVELWTGVEMGASESFEHLDLWLATTIAPMLTLAPSRGAVDAGLVASALPFNAPALAHGASFAYRTVRPTGGADACEIGIIGHGPDSDRVIARYAEQVAAWAVHRPDNATVTVRRRRSDNTIGDTGRGPRRHDPLGQPDSKPAASRMIRRPHTDITISWP